MISKKSLIHSVIFACILTGYLFYLGTFIDISKTEAVVIITEIIVSTIVVLVNVKSTQKINFYFDFLYLILISVLTALTLDFLNGTFEYSIEDSTKYALIRFLISSAFIFFLYCFVIALIGRIKLAIYIGFCLIVIGGIIGYMVYEFRGARLLFADVAALQTAIEVSSGYTNIPVKAPLLLGIISILCIIPILLKLKKITLTRYSRKRLGFYWLFVFGFFTLINSNFDNFLYTWSEPQNSYVYSFFANFKFLEIKPSRSYNVAEIEDILNETNKNVKFINSDYNPKEIITNKFPDYVNTKHTTNPNIIAIMNESLTDIDVYGESDLSNTIFSYLNSLPNTLKGYVYGDVRGGGTADAEYDFLTGNSTLILANNARPYQFYLEEESPNLVSYLDKQDYYTVSIHPGFPFSWNRDVVYEKLGFEESIFVEDFAGYESVRLDSLYSDFSTYQQIFKLFDEEQEDPYFIFDVTIQNHGGYTLDYKNLDKIELEEDYSKELTEFLSLMKKSDDAFKYLVDYFTNQNEPTIILIFGDHQPKFTEEYPDYVTDEDMTAEEIMSLYKTPYYIWANYELPTEQVGDISINYLSTVLLECTGLKLSVYNSYLANLHKSIKAITRNGIVTKDNKFYTYEEDIPDNYLDLINEYRNILYYNIVDLDNNDISLFEVYKE